MMRGRDVAPIPPAWKAAMLTFEDVVAAAPLTLEDGDGFLATVPDLPGCMSDGEIHGEAVRNAGDAIADWVDAARGFGPDNPPPRRYAGLLPK